MMSCVLLELSYVWDGSRRKRGAFIVSSDRIREQHRLYFDGGCIAPTQERSMITFSASTICRNIPGYMVSMTI